MPSFTRPRKVVELAAIAPPDAPRPPPPDAAWRRQQRRADRAEARRITPLRAGWHPRILVGCAPDLRGAEAAAAALPALKRGDRSVVVRIPRLAGAEDLGPVVLKHYLPGTLADPRDACGRSKAARSLLAARALQRRGFRVAAPLAAWSRPGAGSWLLLQALEGHEPLHQAVERLEESARRELLAEFAACLRRLHAAGVAYRDLKPSNVMVAAGPGARIAFIDHDRNRFYAGPAPARLARRDLAAAHAGLPPRLRASERCRALAVYDPGLLEPARWRREVRPVLLEAARRRHRWIARRLLGGA